MELKRDVLPPASSMTALIIDPRKLKGHALFITGTVSILFLCSVMVLFACTHGKHFFRLSDRSVTTLPDIVDDLKSARLVFVGELHDNKAHHQVQLDIIRTLKDSGVPVAIGLEMFQSDYQDALDEWIAGKSSPEEFIQSYYENWRMPWPLYRDIFLYARKNGIPLVGLNVSEEIVSQVARHGFASLKPEQLRKIPGVSCSVDTAYERFIRNALGEHGKGAASFRNFCEAQMVWDSAMALNLINYVKNHSGVTVIVLAGGGHSWKYGIPEQVRRQSDYPFRVILPELTGRLTRENVTDSETDYLWLDI
jgi:uncharacterized iron-regulated protein